MSPGMSYLNAVPETGRGSWRKFRLYLTPKAAGCGAACLSESPSDVG